MDFTDFRELCTKMIQDVSSSDAQVLKVDCQLDMNANEAMFYIRVRFKQDGQAEPNAIVESK